MLKKYENYKHRFAQFLISAKILCFTIFELLSLYFFPAVKKLVQLIILISPNK